MGGHHHGGTRKQIQPAADRQDGRQTTPDQEQEGVELCEAVPFASTTDAIARSDTR